MKTLFFSTLMLFFISSSYAQIFKFDVDGMCQREKTDGGSWTKWTDWSDVDLKIDIDFNKDQVIIHLNGKMVYKISEYKEEEIDSDGDSTHEFVCTDPDGVSCRIRLVMAIQLTNLFVLTQMVFHAELDW